MSTSTETVGNKSMDALVQEWKDWAMVPHVAVDVVPAGWISSDQYSRIAGLSPKAGAMRLTRGVQAGQLEMKAFKVLCRDGRTARRVLHYRIKKPRG